MKKRLQGFIAGTVLGVILTSGIAIAANTTTLYDVMTNGIKIFVDGQKINPKDAQGKSVEPFIYNGTTYLPVRAVADALGKAVYWDGPNYTVYLGQAPTILEYPTIQLEDMTSISDRINRASILTDNYGNTYGRAIYQNYSTQTHEYLLNMKYRRFKGTLYIPNGKNSSGTTTFSVIADGKTIYTSPLMDKTSSPVYVDVNVTGYNDLKIEFSGDRHLQLCLAEAGFYQ